MPFLFSHVLKIQWLNLLGLYIKFFLHTTEYHIQKKKILTKLQAYKIDQLLIDTYLNL